MEGGWVMVKGLKRQFRRFWGVFEEGILSGVCMDLCDFLFGEGLVDYS